MGFGSFLKKITGKDEKKGNNKVTVGGPTTQTSQLSHPVNNAAGKQSQTANRPAQSSPARHDTTIRVVQARPAALQGQNVHHSNGQGGPAAPMGHHGQAGSPPCSDSGCSGVTVQDASTKDLWGQAYAKLLEEEPELMDAYNQHLKARYCHSQGSNRPSYGPEAMSPGVVKAILQGLGEERKAKQWKLELFGKEIKVREQGEKLVKFLLWADGMVKAATSASPEPYSALAWSGVAVIMPVSHVLASPFLRCVRVVTWG